MNQFLATTLSPAYGRDYKSKAEVIDAFNSGNDFSVGRGTGPYCSIRDFSEGTELSIRYRRLTEVVLVKKVGKKVVER